VRIFSEYSRGGGVFRVAQLSLWLLAKGSTTLQHVLGAEARGGWKLRMIAFWHVWIVKHMDA
jgi:hypothetical protein